MQIRGRSANQRLTAEVTTSWSRRRTCRSPTKLPRPSRGITPPPLDRSEPSEQIGKEPPERSAQRSRTADRNRTDHPASANSRPAPIEADRRPPRAKMLPFRTAERADRERSFSFRDAERRWIASRPPRVKYRLPELSTTDRQQGKRLPLPVGADRARSTPLKTPRSSLVPRAEASATEQKVPPTPAGIRRKKQRAKSAQNRRALGEQDGGRRSPRNRQSTREFSSVLFRFLVFGLVLVYFTFIFLF